MVLDFFDKSPVYVVLRKYFETYFLVRICKQTQCILGIQRMDNLPDSWPDEYVQSLIIRGDEVFRKKISLA